MNKKTILVTGGAGYIGSVIVHEFLTRGYEVIVLDNSKYFFEQGEKKKKSHFFSADYADTHTLEKIFTSFNISAVIHCAAFIDVGASVREPLAYYENNVAKTITLLQSMRAHNVQTIIFSSSCAVYGMPQWLPLTEDHPKKPISPYGATKLMVEQIMRDAAHAHDLKYVALRYFNAAGALPQENLGECHEPETHIIPLLLRAAYEQQPFTIFGADYNTADGTCVRDFLHVRDIADAHVKAFEYLVSGGASESFNLGTGSGLSVSHMVHEVEKITGRSIHVNKAARRAGDPDTLVADARKAQTVLGWQPRFSDISTIISSAAEFYVQKKLVLENQHSCTSSHTFPRMR